MSTIIVSCAASCYNICVMSRNWELYKVFYHVAKCASLTDAAKELSITQPAVSQSMKQLEQQLHVKLFVRQAKGIKLTKEGELLYASVAAGNEAFTEAERKLHEIENLNDGEIRIGASDLAIKYYLLSHLELFRSNYPHISVDFETGTDADMIRKLQDGKLDLVLSETEPVSPGSLSVRKVRDIQDIFVAGGGYSYLRSPNLPYQLLTHLPLIGHPAAHPQRQHVDDFLAGMQLNIRPAYTFDDADMILQFALKNIGIGCLPEDYAASAIKSGELIRLSFTPEVPKRALYLISRQRAHVSKATDTLLQLLDK